MNKVGTTDETPDAVQPKQRGPEGLRAVERATRVLLTLAAHPEGITLAELAREAELTLTTAHRMTTALRPSRLTRETPDGQQALGPGTLILARGFLGGLDFRVEALPVLSELRETSGETCHLGTLAVPHVVYVDKLDSTHSVRVMSRIGGTVPAATSSIGRAILAYSPKATITSAVETSARQLGITLDAASLEETLAEVRSRRYAVDHGEHDPGVRCVGAPIFDAEGHVIAGISVSIPAVRFLDDQIDTIGRLVRNSADQISDSLGASSWADR